MNGEVDDYDEVFADLDDATVSDATDATDDAGYASGARGAEDDIRAAELEALREAAARREARAAAAAARPTGAPAPLPSLTPLLLLPLLLAAVVYFGRSFEISDRYRVDLDRVRCNAPPAGPAAPIARKDLQRMSLHELERSLFDPDLGFVVRQVFEESPWVREVRSVRRKFPRGLEVELAYRRPFVAVRRGDRYLFADVHGDLLPVTSDRPVLDGPVLTCRGVIGELEDEGAAEIDPYWFSDAVREGVAVLRELRANRRHPVWQKVGIVAIDVANYAGRLDPKRSEVYLVSDRNWSDPQRKIVGRPVLVRWGRSRAHLLGRAQLPVRDKLDNLLGAVREQPGLQGVSLVDVRFKTPIYLPDVENEIVQGD